jgi:hypothetical protein
MSKSQLNPSEKPAIQSNNYENNKCTVCFETNLSSKQYYCCTRVHNLCAICYHKHSVSTLNSERSSKCPTCKSGLKNEFKQPIYLTVPEINSINVKELNVNSIYIHQNYKLQQDTDIIKICLNKTETFFHSCDGKIVMYLDMFVGKNGFLYSYNKRYKSYHIAVAKNKYQFWDASKMVLQL